MSIRRDNADLDNSPATMSDSSTSLPASGPPGRRPICPTCARAVRACICRWIAPTANSVDVLILQHPDEANEAKGSARLLHLSLAHNRLMVGECFPPAQLDALLHGADAEPRIPLLLYPPTAAGLLPVPSAEMHAPTPAAQRLRLVVIDATWRKSVKMLLLNPLLQPLPRVALHDSPPTAYTIRKARRPHQLSTLEATCHALAQLEQDPARYAGLLSAFGGFVAQQHGFRANGQ